MNKETLNNTKDWREENGIIYFSVTTNGLTGNEWIERLESKQFGILGYAKHILISEDFKPAEPGKEIEVVVLRGNLFQNRERMTGVIRRKASEMGLETPNVEIACLIREKYPVQGLGVMYPRLIVVMHEPIIYAGIPFNLKTDYDDGVSHIGASTCFKDYLWRHDISFAFVRP